MKIEKLKIDEIKSNTSNPRFIKDDKYKKLVNSIREFPEMLQIRPIVIDEDGVVLGGNMRLRACKEAGIKEVPVIRASDLSEYQKREFIIKDNASFGEWDWDVLQSEWNIGDLTSWGIDAYEIPSDVDYSNGFNSNNDDDENDNRNQNNDNGSDEDSEENSKPVSLVEKFVIPPFSIFDTKQGYWQSRKRAWKDLGIKSEAGRDENLLKYSETILNMGKGSAESTNLGTSIFDPVICEISYKWFCPEDGHILDPFAGGSVRGIVASKLGYDYTGIDLREEQVSENRIQAEEICKDNKKPNWIVGTSEDVDSLAPGKYDMIFTCPPYYDLEVYSEDENDLSNMSYEEFDEAYFKIIKKSIQLLNEDSFSIFVVGDVRRKDGFYLDFIGKTIQAHEEAGASLYNNAIILEPTGSAAMKASRNMNSGRKLTKIHQNYLVFFKGNPKKIKEKFGEVINEESLEENSIETPYGEKIKLDLDI